MQEVIDESYSSVLINVQNVSKQFSKAKVLNNVSLTIKDSEIITIIGKSGVGKTTLLKLISGLLLPDNGTITIDGETPNSALTNRKIGFVFQRQLLFDWLNLEDNIALPLKIMKLEEGKQNKVNKQLELFGLREHRYKFPYQVSGGIYQRATVARALIYDPRLLLLDEPFNSLDDFTKDNLLRDLRKIWKNTKMTAILVTHAIREAFLLSDRIIVLSSQNGFEEINSFNINHDHDVHVQYFENYEKIVESMS